MAQSLDDAITALKKDDWEGAHAIVQALPGRDAAWVHAHLHRIEGDLFNASYWYRRAERPDETGPLEAERSEIIKTLSTPS